MEIYITDNNVILVGDTWNHRVRAILPNGTVTTIAGTGKAGRSAGDALATKINGPTGIVYANGMLYFSEQWNNSLKAMNISFEDLSPYASTAGLKFDKNVKTVQLWVQGKNINGKESLPYVEKGKSFIPMKATCDALGIKMNYNTKTKLMELIYNGKTTTLKKSEYTTKGTLNYVAARLFVEKLSLKITWVNDYKAVVISK